METPNLKPLVLQMSYISHEKLLSMLLRSSPPKKHFGLNKKARLGKECRHDKYHRTVRTLSAGLYLIQHQRLSLVGRGKAMNNLLRRRSEVEIVFPLARRGLNTKQKAT